MESEGEVTDVAMIAKARAAGYRRTKLGEYGTHTICRHGRIEKNGKRKHRCIRYALETHTGIDKERGAALESEGEMSEINKDVIAKTITSLAATFDRELYGKTKEQLETYWMFEFDPSKTVASNLYTFHERLKLYGGFCRRWEEHHHGSCCVVERVRDQYLWPKIEQFMCSCTRRKLAELQACYARFQHLDTLFEMVQDSDGTEQTDPFHAAARDMWRAIKAAVAKEYEDGIW